jgi:hypothetical protein
MNTVTVNAQYTDRVMLISATLELLKGSLVNESFGAAFNGILVGHGPSRLVAQRLLGLKRPVGISQQIAPDKYQVGFHL